MMNKLFKYLVISLVVSCQTNGSFQRPNYPLCIGLSDNSLSCVINDEQYTDSPENHICSSVDGYEAYENYVDCLEKSLLKCFKNPKKCLPSTECGWKPKKQKNQ